MLDAIKKLDKKFLVFACCVLMLPIIIILFLVIIQGCNTKKTTYEGYEKKMISAAKKYFDDNDLIPTEESATVSIDLNKLIEEKYISDSSKSLGDDTCKGKVTVRRNGSSIEETDGGYLNYTVDLNCENYNTNSLVSLLKKDLTTSESGLYQVGDSYIFKGDEANNYLNFYGTSYRILSIDKNGIIKLLKVESEITSQEWDTKYNSEVKASYGKNIYKDSSIRKKLMDYYNNDKKLKPKAREKVIAYDVCIGSRKISDTSLNNNGDCAAVLENQPVSLINITDYANASLDSECNGITSKSCRNYNYLKQINLGSWTLNAVSNNTYEVYYLVDGVIYYQEASRYNSYNIVIYIDGSEIVKSGKGTKTEPYVIE